MQSGDGGPNPNPMSDVVEGSSSDAVRYSLYAVRCNLDAVRRNTKPYWASPDSTVYIIRRKIFGVSRPSPKFQR